MIETLLTIPQAAAEYKVSVAAVRTWWRTGRIQAVKKGGRVLITRGELSRLLEGVCPMCGERFRKGTLRQVYCRGRSCRQAAHRLQLRSKPPPTTKRKRKAAGRSASKSKPAKGKVYTIHDAIKAAEAGTNT